MLERRIEAIFNGQNSIFTDSVEDRIGSQSKTKRIPKSMI